jgi:hypothetical protein
MLGGVGLKRLFAAVKLSAIRLPLCNSDEHYISKNKVNILRKTKSIDLKDSAM